MLLQDQNRYLLWAWMVKHTQKHSLNAKKFKQWERKHGTLSKRETWLFGFNYSYFIYLYFKFLASAQYNFINTFLRKDAYFYRKTRYDLLLISSLNSMLTSMLNQSLIFKWRGSMSTKDNSWPVYMSLFYTIVSLS